MKADLDIEITQLIKALKASKKFSLAKQIEDNWDKTCVEYSRELNLWQPEGEMEKEIMEAFDGEFERLEVTKNIRIKLLNSLKQRRVIQSGPHLCATEGPRMLCINWLGSLGVKMEDFYVVGMFSGIPFSNSFHPGRINRKDGSINLFPSNMQDAMVYRSVIQEKLPRSINDLPKDMKRLEELLPKPEVGGSYTSWALRVCQNIERKILGRENLFYIDINEVITKYLVRVLRNKEHVLYKIFFAQEERKEFAEVFPNETIFYIPVTDGKYEKIESIVFDGEVLKSKSKTIFLNDPKNLIYELENGRLCPGLNILFLVLAFLNQFKCLGSFYQVEYLPQYQQKFAKLKFMKSFRVERIPTANLTTGVFPQHPNFYPVDIILGEKLKASPDVLFGELLIPIKDTLLHDRHK